VRLLLIEDTLASLALVEAIAKRWPHVSVLGAMYGRQGLKLARHHQPALILLDLELPDLHGIQVLQRLREDPSTCHIPVITLGREATRALSAYLQELGAHAHVTKPLDVARVMEVAGNILASAPSRRIVTRGYAGVG
jgi:CheY-like chemotaxis protein